MANLIDDSFDFEAYRWMTDAKMKVKPASGFDLVAEFADRASHAEMFSTKLRGLIEFRPGELTVLAGYNGSRKSTFAGQIALDLCVQREPTLIMSPEMAPAKTLGRMARQAFACARPTNAQLERFQRWTDGRLWLVDHLGRLTPDLTLAIIRYFCAELAGKHVFIDSMMMVCESEEHLDSQKQMVGDLVRVGIETGAHIYLVAHARKPPGKDGEDTPPSKYDVKGSSVITDQASNVLTIATNKAKMRAIEAGNSTEEWMTQPDVWVTCEKQRNGAWEGRAGLWACRKSFRFLDSRMAPCEPYVLSDAP